MLPKDPVAKRMSLKNSEGKRPSANISETTVVESGNGGNKKAGIGKSGVHLRYHKPEEYDTLTRAQKKELMEWRSNNGGGKAGGVSFKKKKMIASASRAHIQEIFDKQAKAFIVSQLEAQKVAMDAIAATNAAGNVSATTAKAPNAAIASGAATASGKTSVSIVELPSKKTKNLLKEILRKAQE